MPNANDRIGPYQLIRKLGEGGFGEVWLAQGFSGSSAREVVIKMPLKSEIDFDALLQEASSWMRVPGHPNVLEFIATRVFDGQIVMVSEYAPDGSLENWLSRSGGRASSIEAAVAMTVGILEGLEHLHDRGVIHRDLKPDNVMLRGSTPRLADFGVSRILKSTNDGPVAAGAAPYLAPEAFDRKRDQQTDLWSVGVMLYQMTSGRLPFDAADPTDLHDAVCNREPDPPGAAPGWLQEVVAKALLKDPKRRYKTTAEMRAALTSQSRAIVEEPALPTYRMSPVDERPLRREPNLAAAVSETTIPDKPNLAAAVDEIPSPDKQDLAVAVREIPLPDKPTIAVTVEETLSPDKRDLWVAVGETPRLDKPTVAVVVEETPRLEKPTIAVVVDEITPPYEPILATPVDEIPLRHEPDRRAAADEIPLRHEPDRRAPVNEIPPRHEPDRRAPVNEIPPRHEPDRRVAIDESLVQHEPDNQMSVGELLLQREPYIITPRQPKGELIGVLTPRVKPFKPPPPQKRRSIKRLIGWVAGALVIALVIALAVYLVTKSATSPVPANTSSPSIIGQTFTENLNGVKLEMVGAPAGSFLMGSPEKEPGRTSAEGPQRRVTVKAFSIGKYEVTQAQWNAVMDGKNPSRFKGDDLPVENVSWNDAKEFCQKLSQITGKRYGLPSEAEWEYASRSKTKGTYPSHLTGMAWYSSNSPGRTQSVGKKLPNAFELYDMHGNVWEWCEDVWHKSYDGESSDPPNDARAWLTGGEQGFRALRGGSWNNDIQGVRSAVRVRASTGARGPHIGFRVVVSSRRQ